jgi:hypothetical protein
MVERWTSRDTLALATHPLAGTVAIHSQGRTIWIVDAHRDNGKRFLARADVKLTAFVEPESATRGCAEMA